MSLQDTIIIWVSTFFGCLFLLFIISFFVSLRKSWKEMEAWSKRDQELSNRFFEALDKDDLEEASRIQYQITKNFQGWKNQD